MSKYKQNITMISDLNELEEVDEFPSSKPVNFERASYNKEYDRPDTPNLDKFIRPNNNNKLPFQSGMQSSHNIVSADDSVSYNIPAENLPLVPNRVEPPFYDSYNGPYWNKSYPPFNPQDEYNEYDKIPNRYSNLNRYYENFENQKQQPSCVDLADHAANCKVCTKLYKNDRSIYIIIIVILVIICILLLKRILDTQ